MNLKPFEAGMAGIDRVEIGLELRDVAAVVRALSGVNSFCTTLPPLSSNTRWNPAKAFSWPNAAAGDHRGALVAEIPWAA